MSDTPNPDATDPTEQSTDEELVEAEILDDPTLDLPDDPAEAVPVLIGELMASRSAQVEATDKWKRAAAEFENFRRRSIRDQEALIVRSSERVVTQLLPVLDSLDAAMGLDAESENESKMLSGMAGTRELLLATLTREGVEPIPTEGVAFDPALHEAVQVAEGDGTMIVAAEFRRGYTVHGKVLRASLVAVGYGEPTVAAVTISEDDEGESAEETPASS